MDDITLNESPEAGNRAGEGPGGARADVSAFATTRTAELMAALLRQTADWRRRKAEEYDHDARNLRSAAGLEELADFVLALPEGDPRLARLGRLAVEGEVFVPGQQTLYEIGRFRFFHDAATPDAFLDRLVELAEADAGEQGRFGGRLPEGDDPWG